MIRLLLASGLVFLGTLPAHADGYWAGEGYVVPRDGVTLRVRSTMLVSKVLCDVGTTVKKGDALLQFDDRNARIDLRIAELNLKKKELELRQAMARIEIAKGNVVRAQADFERTQKAVQQNVGSKEELSKAEAAFAGAKAELTAAEVSVEIARTEVETGKAFLTAEEMKVDELTLRAPFDGIIVARYTTVGDWISKPDQGLLDLVGNHLLIEAAVPSRLLTLLKDQTPIEIAQDIEGGGEKTFKAKVALVGPVIDPRNKTVKVQFAIPENEMKSMKPGLLVTVKVGTRKDKDGD